MISNYFKIALRNLKRNFTFSLINILGLTMGLAITSLIALYVSHELSYDQYHKDADQIYRLYSKMSFSGYQMSGPGIKSPMGPFLKESFPKVLEQTRISNDFQRTNLLIGENTFEEKILFADASYFKMFNHKLIAGDLENALKNPFDMVLTTTMAQKLFGSQNPIGKTIEDNNGNIYQVTAVLQELPTNSYLQFKILCSLSSMDDINIPGNINNWGDQNVKDVITYVKLAKGYQSEELEAEFPRIIRTYQKLPEGAELEISLMPLTSIYLFYEKGKLDRIYLFSVIGLFVLLIACINYMNLNTANSLKRFKEIGVRKVMGAFKRQLTNQLLFESIFISFISLIIALTLAEILLPLFNNLMEKNLSFDYLKNWPLSLGFIGLAIVSGILAGSYPAFYLSSFQPVSALKGKFVFGSKHAFFRNALVILQFAITIFLLSCTGIILKQIRYTNEADLGFDKENLIMIELNQKNRGVYKDRFERGKAINKNLTFLKTEVDKIPELKYCSKANSFPFGGLMLERFNFEEKKENELVVTYHVDENYINLLNFDIIEGRNFDSKNSLEGNNVIVNETLVKKMNWKNPIGQTFTSNEDKSLKFKVIGVVRNFHMNSFHERIFPAMLRFQEEVKYYGSIGIKVSSNNIQKVIMQLDKLNKKLDMNWELNYTFMQDKIEKEYMNEYRTGKMFINFTILAIIIAAMGLYGLTLFQSKLKTKEIGIRKVFGANINNVVLLLSKNFLKLILIAALIGIPAAYLYMDKWLQSFVFQVENRWTVFVAAFFLAIFIAILTILYQALKLAKANPVDSLRYE